MWEYRARLEEVVDGDTIDLKLELGFDTYKIIRVRLKGVDTAEIFGVEHDSDGYERGMQQKRFVEEFLEADEEWPIKFISKERKGKFGRWLGDMEVDEELLTEALIREWPEVEKE